MKKMRKTVLLFALSAILMSLLSGCRITIEPLNSSDKKEESSKPSVIEDIKDIFANVKPVSGPDFLSITAKYGFEELDVESFSYQYWDHQSITVNDIAGCRGVKKSSGGDLNREYIIITWTEFNSEELAKAYFDEEEELMIISNRDYWGGTDGKIENTHYESHWTEYYSGNHTESGEKALNRHHIARIDNTIVYCYDSQYADGGEYDIVDDIFKDLGYFWEE